MKDIASILPILTCSALLPKEQPVSPLPTGPYSGGNSAEGQALLLSPEARVFPSVSNAHANTDTE
jgi:hypothetical protein